MRITASGTRARIRVPTFSWESMLKVPFTWEIRSAMLTSPNPPGGRAIPGSISGTIG